VPAVVEPVAGAERLLGTGIVIGADPTANEDPAGGLSPTADEEPGDDNGDKAAGVDTPVTVTTDMPEDRPPGAPVTVTTDGASPEAELPKEEDAPGAVYVPVAVTTEFSAGWLPKVPVTVTTDGAKFVVDVAGGSTEGEKDDDILEENVGGQGASTVDVTPLTTVWTAQSWDDRGVDIIEALDDGPGGNVDKDE
jgi:hypothetical protein